MIITVDEPAMRDLPRWLAPALGASVGAACCEGTGQAGDAARARDQYAALLPIRERVSGPDHPDTLNTRANAAYWTDKAGVD